MNNGDIKRKFIEYMEEIHVGLLFPKKFIGCMMVVVIENEPITQNRIEELTGYSKTTISQMLNLIQIKFPLIQIKKPGIRKKFYKFDLTIREFMIHFLQAIIDSYKDRVDFMIPLIEDIEPFTQKHSKFYNFKQFLEKFYNISILYLNLLSETEDQFKNMVKTGQINASELLNYNFLSSQKNLEYLQYLLKPQESPPSYSKKQTINMDLLEIYKKFKSDYYQKYRENLTLGESQTMLAKSIIGTELLMENRPLTQEEIESATNIHRSIISDALKLLLEWKMVKLIKKPSDRKKYYVLVQSWDQRMINKLRVNMRYAFKVKEKMANFLKKIEKNNDDTTSNTLSNFLQEINHCYHQFEMYFRLLELKYLNIRLKDKLES